jgi:ATP-dependent helicase/nuclease subunit B
MLKLNYLSHAWALRWDKLVSGYLIWQLEREVEGWRWHAGEVPRKTALPLADDTLLTLRGTLDRIDRRGTEYAVLDYKTRAPTALRAQLNTPGEDVQLPVYTLLAEEEISSAGYLSLDREAIKPVPLEADLSQLAQAVGERLSTIFSALHAGAALPAQGVEAACNWCEVRGLCRRGHWHEAAP